MKPREALKQEICAAIDRRAEEVIRIGEAIRGDPELGLKEAKTAGLVAETLRALGLTPRTGLALTGVRADINCARPGPAFGLLGELDRPGRSRSPAG